MKKGFQLLAILTMIIAVSIPVVVAGSPDCDVTIRVNLEGIIEGGPLDGQVYEGTLIGTPGNDCIYGQPNYVDDLILGKGGNDWIHGNTGSDVIKGGPGDDIIMGGSESDTLIGGPGNDILEGASGDDLIKGGSGNDMLEGSHGSDILIGGPGDDKIDCSPDYYYDDYDLANGGGGYDTADDMCEVLRSVEFIIAP